MKKQTKFKIYLLVNLFFILTSCSNPLNTQYLLAYSDQDTIKNCNQKLNEIKQKIDSTQLKWDAIEKALKEKQQQQPK